MEHLHKPETLRCEAVAQILESSIADTPLTRQQKDAIHHHAQHCRDCHNLVTLMHQFRDFSDSLHAADFAEEISSVRKEWQHLRLSQSLKAPRLSIWAVSVAAAAIVLFGLWQLFTPAEAPESPVASPFSAPCTPAGFLSPVDGVQITSCRELGMPETVVRDGDVRVILSQGSVSLDVDPNWPHPKTVTVQTPGGEIRVKGTLFAVHVDQRDERVEVFRGVVEVSTEKADFPSLRVSAGTGAGIRTGKKYALKHPIREQLIVALKEQPATTLSPPGVVPDATDTGNDAARNAVGKPGTDAPGNTVKPSSSAPQADTKPVRAGSGRIESLESLLEAARFCLIENDWRCAKTHYSEALRHYAHHPAISAVRVSLAKLELRRLNAPEKALVHYNAYLQKYPNGPLVEDALLGIANAHRQLHQTTGEMTALRRLLSRFPNSAMATKAQTRLTQLEANQPR